MAFTFYSPPILTPEQANPLARNFIGEALQTYMQGQQSKYAPDLLKAEIFNKEFGPLAQIASSPLALAMLPEQREQMTRLISQLLQKTGGGGNGQFPLQQGGMSSSQGGVPAQSPAVNVSGEFGAHNAMSPEEVQRTTDMHERNLEENSLLPGAGQGLGGAVTAKTTGGYYESPYTPGKQYSNKEGKQFVSPTGSIISQAQEQENAIKNFNTFVPNLINHAKEFTQPGSNLKRYASGASARARRIGVNTKIADLISKDPEMAGRYESFQGEISRAANVLKAVFPSPKAQEAFDQHIGMLQLLPNDTAKSYAERVKGVQKELQNMLPTIKEAMGSKGGYSLSREKNKKPEEVRQLPDGTEVHKINGEWYPVLG